jgi:hypothetical protein
VADHQGIWDQLSIEAKQNTLTVKGEKVAKTDEKRNNPRSPVRVIFEVSGSSVGSKIFVRCPPESRHTCRQMGRFSSGPTRDSCSAANIEGDPVPRGPHSR